MSLYKNKLGKFGENMAVDYLKNNGYQIIQRNFRCQFGETDIISFKNGTYIFIEVKTRKSLGFGRPAEAITYKKLDHMRKVAQYYIQINRLGHHDFRFDVIEIITGKKEINHIENIMM